MNMQREVSAIGTSGLDEPLINLKPSTPGTFFSWYLSVHRSQPSHSHVAASEAACGIFVPCVL